MPLKKNLSFNTLMKVTYDDDDHGTAEGTRTTVLSVIESVDKFFPGAAPNHRLAKHLAKILGGHGFSGENTLLATSLCSDEANRDVEDEFRLAFGNNYSMGGLAGFAFGGLTAFGAVTHHMPPGGNCLLIYGPHVGIDWDGKLGKVNRKGHRGSGACCGPANAALEYVRKVRSGEMGVAEDPHDLMDSQQTWVMKELLAHGERLEKAEDPMAELPLALYDCQDELIKRLVAKGCGQMVGDGKIAVLGGITINTPEGSSEYFLPKKCEIMNGSGEVVADLLEELKDLPPLHAKYSSSLVSNGRSSLAGSGTKTYG